MASAGKRRPARSPRCSRQSAGRALRRYAPYQFSIVNVGAPVATSSPATIMTSTTVPAIGDGTSTLALSVSTSISKFPSASRSPGFALTSITKTLLAASPTLGILSVTRMLQAPRRDPPNHREPRRLSSKRPRRRFGRRTEKRLLSTHGTPCDLRSRGVVEQMNPIEIGRDIDQIAALWNVVGANAQSQNLEVR